MKPKQKNILLAAAVVAGVLMLSFCSRNNSAASFSGGAASKPAGKAPAFPVIAEPASLRDLSEHIVTTATLEADRLIDVLAKTAGEVVEVLVEEGVTVAQGAVLARLDQQEILLEVREAEAHVENYSAIFERTRELMNSDLVTKEEYERQRYQLELNRIKLEQARVKLQNTELRSSIPGIITNRLIDAGHWLGVNQKAFSIGDFDPLYAVINIPERQIGAVREGQRVAVALESMAGKDFSGRVKRISPVVDAASGTIRITVELDQSDHALKPGMFATLSLPIHTKKSALAVPKKAVLLERELELVFIFNEGVATRTPVNLGLSEGDWVEITSGLSPGDLVITVGQESLRDGDAVRLAGPSEEPASDLKEASGTTERQPTADDRSRNSRGGGQDGFDPERWAQLIEGLLSDPKIKKAYDSKLKQDPDLETNMDKQREFFIPYLRKMRQQ
ncbi:Multidrug resistance protein MdtA [subsurface metagenome]